MLRLEALAPVYSVVCFSATFPAQLFFIPQSLSSNKTSRFELLVDKVVRQMSPGHWKLLLRGLLAVVPHWHCENLIAF